MDSYLYLSMIPEALIASMLPPNEFGNYLATGTNKRTRGEAIFFEIDPSLKNDYFDFSQIDKKCIPHPDGEPKHTYYISIYRVLEHIDLTAIKNLYLITFDGRVLELEKKEYQRKEEEDLHLYQELCPVNPLIISKLNPIEYIKFITDSKRPVSLPQICFTELTLGALSADPAKGDIHDLPYSNIQHLRDCLLDLKSSSSKLVKTYIRSFNRDIIYRLVHNGFFIGNQKDFLYYPFPTIDELQNKHYVWWRSALTIPFGPS